MWMRRWRGFMCERDTLRYERTHTAKKKMKPLTINFTAFVEIYSRKRNDHSCSITKDTELEFRSYSLAQTQKCVKLWSEKDRKCSFFQSKHIEKPYFAEHNYKCKKNQPFNNLSASHQDATTAAQIHPEH